MPLHTLATLAFDLVTVLASRQGCNLSLEVLASRRHLERCRSHFGLGLQSLVYIPGQQLHRYDHLILRQSSSSSSHLYSAYYRKKEHRCYSKN